MPREDDAKKRDSQPRRRRGETGEEVPDPVSLYIKEMGQAPLLTPEEERELALEVETSRLLRDRVSNMTRETGQEPSARQIALRTLRSLRGQENLIRLILRLTAPQDQPEPTVAQMSIHPDLDQGAKDELRRIASGQEEILPAEAGLDQLLESPEVSESTKRQAERFRDRTAAGILERLARPEVRQQIDFKISEVTLELLSLEAGLEETNTRARVTQVSLDSRIIPPETGWEEFETQEDDEYGLGMERWLARHFASIAAAGDLARERLIIANIRLVISVAKRHLGYGIPLTDLAQEGVLGLMHAVSKFEHRRGNKFGTYATWWIRQAIGRAVAKQGRTIRLPVHRLELIRKVEWTKRRIVQETGDEPTLEELAEEIGLTPDRVREIQKISPAITSLDQELEDDEGNSSRTMADLIPAPAEEEETERERDQDILREQMKKILDQLDEREARVIRIRFGIPRGNPMTLEQTGKIIGMSKEGVRLTEIRALRKLREPGLADSLREFLE